MWVGLYKHYKVTENIKQKENILKIYKKNFKFKLLIRNFTSPKLAQLHLLKVKTMKEEIYSDVINALKTSKELVNLTQQPNQTKNKK